jgi:hypothetical protein
VCEVWAVVLVHGQAQAALEAADVVLEEVRVLVEVDRLERELAETLSAVGICGRGWCDTAAAELGACAVLCRLANALVGASKKTYLVIHGDLSLWP